MNTVHDERPTDRPPSRLATVSPEPGTGLGAPTPRPLPDTSRRVLVMGIVNRTQDSFFDEGRTWELE